MKAECRRFETGLHAYLDINAPELLRAIRDTKVLSDETKAALKTQIAGFKETFVAALNQPAEA